MKGIVIFFFSAVTLLSVQRNAKEPVRVHLETPLAFPKMPTNEKNPLTEEGIELGRRLFYDPILSADNSFSCATCHQQKFAFSDGRTKGIGIHGDTLRRNTPGLFNLAWYPQLFWDGRASSLETQVFEPVRKHNEMDLNWSEAERKIQKQKHYRDMFKAAFGSEKVDSVKIARAIAQFERSMISANSKFDQVLRGERFLSESEYRGFILMNDQNKGNCLHCHTSDGDALGTNGQMVNNGLQRYTNNTNDIGLAELSGNPLDIGKFKVPSLRNLVFTAPYMHDGRFETLEEVLDFYSEGVKDAPETDARMARAKHGGMQLTDQEKQDIINFLKTMSDSSFITNPAFSSPFQREP
ncbi:MAG: c-type cytochrome [bacterium]|nr:c-type cytochrome [bacterium]